MNTAEHPTVRAPSTRTTTCRSCGSPRLRSFLDLGRTPLADRIRTADELDEPELVADLEVVFCEECTLAQLTESVDPDVLFWADYPYYSSVSPELVRHFHASADELLQERRLGPGHLVVEAASNDGYMLHAFLERGVPVLGIDPAAGPVAVARERGVATLQTYFGVDLARRLRDEGRRADVFLANNVLAHVPDLNGFVAGIATLLHDDGVAVIEAPYLVDLVGGRQFDTMYHQHLCYFSVTALDRLFRRHGLYLNRIRRLAIHGGSLRLFVEPFEARDPSVSELLAAEERDGVTRFGWYEGFGADVRALAASLVARLEELRAGGARLAGYGAAAKACTLMNVCGVDRRHLDYIVDRNPLKQGRFMGGNHLPIHPPERLLVDRPDFLLILAWNFADEIIAQQTEYHAGGGAFVVPVPEVRVVR